MWKRRASLTYGSFLIARVRRLYPALIGVVVIGCGLIAITRSLPFQQATLGGSLALTQVNSFVEGLQIASTEPFGVTWSLSAEWMFYLLWPLALLAGRRLTAKRMGVIAAVLAAILYLASLQSSPEWFYYGPISRGSQLLAGAAIAFFVARQSPPTNSSKAVGLSAAVALCCVVIWVILGPEHVSPLYRAIGFPMSTAAGATLILVGINASAGWVTRILSLPWLTAIGRASYSLYLWHVIPVMVLDKDLLPLPNVALAVIGVLSTTLLTFLSYRFLERPFLSARSSELRAPASAGTAK